MNDDRLAFILRAPALVERVVRGTLREALRSRRYQSGALELRTFANAALSELERIALAKRLDLDAIGRLELQNATVSAAGCLASSAVARRLFSVPIERFRAAPAEIDAAVVDTQRRLHLIRVELVTGAAARTELASRIGRSLPEMARLSAPPLLHLMSARDGRLRSFGEVGSKVNDIATERMPSERTAIARAMMS
jgi:hypothetical protein